MPRDVRYCSQCVSGACLALGSMATRCDLLALKHRMGALGRLVQTPRLLACKACEVHAKCGVATPPISLEGASKQILCSL